MSIAIPETIAAQYAAMVAEANALATEYRTQTGDEDARIAAFLESTDDENVVKVREWLATAIAKRAEIDAKIDEAKASLTEIGRENVSADYDAAAAEARFLPLRKEITTKRKLIEGLFGEDAFTALGVEEIISLKQRTTRTGSGDGKGAGVSRSSFSDVTVNGTSLAKPTPSEAAAFITKEFGKVTAGELRESLTAAHGDVSEKYGEVFSFSHTVTDKAGKSTVVNLTVTPTENIRRQPKSDETDNSGE